MLNALCRRGPDSTGTAIFGPAQESRLILRIKLGERGHFEARGRAVAGQLRSRIQVYEEEVLCEYLRVVVDESEPEGLIKLVEGLEEGLEVVSLGRRMEIAKQVGSPQNLDRSYGIRSQLGTHGIGHTRLSTESRVDLSHSQPFWARGLADVVTVHNGHITNYHKLRRQYEQRGVRFFTENDSEIIGIYLRDRLARGLTFEEALIASLDDFDGSFSYLAANADCLAFVKDRFSFKPLLVAESDRFVALATEEGALRAGLKGPFEVFEAGSRRCQIWPVIGRVQEVA